MGLSHQLLSLILQNTSQDSIVTQVFVIDQPHICHFFPQPRFLAQICFTESAHIFTNFLTKRYKTFFSNTLPTQTNMRLRSTDIY